MPIDNCHHSKLLHQTLPYRPHPSPLAVHVHRYREQQTSKLNTPECEEYCPGAIHFEPVDNEQRKNQAVKYV
jgi:hypothetical protein